MESYKVIIKSVCIFLTSVFVMSACQFSKHKTAANKKVNRQTTSVANQYYTLGADYQQKYWHKSQGSPLIPYPWAVRMLNLKTPNKDGSYSPLLEKLDEKNNLIKDEKSPYLLDWVGLSATWTNENDRSSDILKAEKEEAKNFKLDNFGNPQVAMLETNCALCHTGQLKVGDEKFIIDGAPGLFNVFGFFQDMAGSVAALMFKADELAKFLLTFGYKDSEVKGLACDFMLNFTDEIEMKRIPFVNPRPTKDECINSIVLTNPPTFDKLNSFESMVSQYLTVDTIGKMREKNRSVLNKYLEELLRMTVYKGTNYTLSYEQKMAMDRVGKLISSYPKAEVQKGGSGIGRNDAFGRIANSILRDKDPLDYYAPVSHPFVWATEYKAAFHYNGNMNSLLLRDIGQSYGLGAVIKEEGTLRSSANIENLIDLENIMHKIEVPQWTKIIGENSLDKNKIIAGCNTYVKQCMDCHTASEKVGPQKKLLQYKVFKINEPGLKTDPNYAVLQSTPYQGKYLKETLMKLVQDTLELYKKDHPDQVNSYGVLKERAKDLALRGPDEFRDTYLGNVGELKNDYMTLPTDAKGNSKGYGYVARHLAGIWATAPFLHNGSVASIKQLMTPPHRRYKDFKINHLEFDTQTLGLKQPSSKEIQAYCNKTPIHCFNAEDSIYAETFYKLYEKYENGKGQLPRKDYITGYGNNNRGHYFESWKNLDDNDIQSLIEFLKVLEPEDEYMWKDRDNLYKIVNNQCLPGQKLKETLIQ